MPEAPAAPANILIVEDDPSVQRMLSRALKSDSRKVAAAASAHEARIKLASQEFDLIVMDLGLETKLAGRELFEELRLDPRRKGIPVIMVSGQVPLPGELMQSLGLGAADIMAKPLSTEVLRAKADKLIKENRGQAPPLVKELVVRLPGDDLSLDVLSRIVTWRGKQVAGLSDDQCRLLELLLRSSPRAITRDEARSLKPGAGRAADPSRAADMLVARLKRLLPRPLRGRIVSIRGIGWAYQAHASPRRARTGL